MIGRREFLLGAGASVATYLAAVEKAEARSSDVGELPRVVPRVVPSEDDDELILYELASFEARYYSEEGVPMLLACENLAEPASGPSVAKAVNTHFETAFRYYSELLGRLRSDLSAKDAAAVVELIAQRDFANGGGEGGS